ncbi:hypothetical protein ACP275_11G069500 [Erythranthe tilingii]
MEKITRKHLSAICIALVVMWTITSAVGSMEDDEKDCAEELTNLAACIPFVSGTAKLPTKDCCDNTNKVRAAKPKCLCVLIIESTDPSIGLPINTTLALQMPTACKIEAKVSDCPSLLKLAADSPNAKIFNVANADSSTPATTTNSPNNSDSTATPKSPSSSDSTKTTSSTSSNTNSSDVAKIATSFFLLTSALFAPISLFFL